MNYKNLAIVLAILLIVVVAVFAGYLLGKGTKSSDEDEDTREEDEDSDTLDQIFDEPPDDFEPPVLPS